MNKSKFFDEFGKRNCNICTFRFVLSAKTEHSSVYACAHPKCLFPNKVNGQTPERCVIQCCFHQIAKLFG